MKQDRRRWKVCFETNYWGTQKGTDPGEELCLDREFEWNGHRWQIPALYRCRQGLVVDFAMEVPQEELRAFMKKWGIAEDGECTRTLTRAEERQMEQEWGILCRAGAERDAPAPKRRLWGRVSSGGCCRER